jgi:hypothetical protein
MKRKRENISGILGKRSRIRFLSYLGKWTSEIRGSEGSRSAAAAPPTPPTISSFCTISKVFISTLSFLQVHLAKGTTLGHIHLTGIEMQW